MRSAAIRSFLLSAAASLFLICIGFVRPASLGAQERNAVITQWPDNFRRKAFTAADTTGIMKTLKLGEKLRNMPADSVLKLLLHVYSQSMLIGFNDGVAGALIEMGRIANQKGNYQQALYLYQDALWYSRHAYTYKHFTAACYSNLGSIHLFRDELNTAAKYFDSSLAEGLRSRLPQERNHLVITYNNLSIVYTKTKRPLLALQYLKQAEDMARRNHFNKELKLTLCNLGDIYAVLERPKEALASYKEALDMAVKDQDAEMIQTTNLALGRFFLKENDPQRAVSYLQQVYENGRPDDVYYGRIVPGYNLGRAHYELKNYPLSERYLTDALREATRTGYSNGALNAHETLGKVYEATGQYKKAIEEFRICEQLNDSLLNKDQLKEINELEIKYSTAQKDAQLALKNRDIIKAKAAARNKNLLLILFSMALLILAAGIIALRYFQKNRIKRIRQQQELDMLRASIAGEETERTRVGQELHDGIGGYFSAIKINLASLRMKMKSLEEEPLFAKTIRIADEANEELREIAHNLVPSFLVRNGFSKAVQDYCSRSLSSGATTITVQVSGEPRRFNAVAELAIYRLLQELLHNIIKHAEASSVTICLSWQESLLMIAIEDDGNGLLQESQNARGIGIDNIRSRIASFNGTMAIDSFAGQGTSVYLEFEIDDTINHNTHE